MDPDIVFVECEKERLLTFAGGQWKVSPENLAVCGFYFLRPPDIVKCAFSGVELGEWESGDNPMKEHKRWSPYCRLLRGYDVGNIGSIKPIRGLGYDVCGMNVRPYSIPEKGFR